MSKDMTTGSRIVLATPHARYDSLEQRLRDRLGLDVLRVRERAGLRRDILDSFRPEYVFFPHWSWIIPAEIHEAHECVIFHVTDVPFGRGGSPLQNLIVRGVQETRLTALRCVAELDAGPVFMKMPLSLLGTAEEILMRAVDLMELMVECIVRERPAPQAQAGQVTTFRRRTAADGDVTGLEGLTTIFDHIRMLDGTGYPPAFFETAHLRFEFTRASLKPDAVIADVKITRKNP